MIEFISGSYFKHKCRYRIGQYSKIKDTERSVQRKTDWNFICLNRIEQNLIVVN